jgi:hypothetical protein
MFKHSSLKVVRYPRVQNGVILIGHDIDLILILFHSNFQSTYIIVHFRLLLVHPSLEKIAPRKTAGTGSTKGVSPNKSLEVPQ